MSQSPKTVSRCFEIAPTNLLRYQQHVLNVCTWLVVFSRSYSTKHWPCARLAACI